MFGDFNVLPLPTLKRIIPVYHAYWNATKSGSDTTTMLVDKCATLHTPVKYTNCNSRMSGRNLMILLVLVHRLISKMVGKVVKYVVRLQNSTVLVAELISVWIALQGRRGFLRGFYIIFLCFCQMVQEEKIKFSTKHAFM